MRNLLLAWREFRRGKRSKPDVEAFEFSLEDNLFQLQQELALGAWRPSPYESFYVRDPKLRHIHKACVRDRVVHQAVFRVLYQIFDSSFIFDSYSCRVGKGTHRAVTRLEVFLRKVSQNHTRQAYALKCDIRKFFDAVDHEFLMALIRKKVSAASVLWLMGQIVESFSVSPGKGLPMGNVTSQLFSNIYLNELDQFMKHTLRVKHYLRYCDDFVVVADNFEYLENLVPRLGEFLRQKLKLELHPKKVIIRKYAQGIDFLGYVSLPRYRVLRTKTKYRIVKKLVRHGREFEHGFMDESLFCQSLESYLGVLKHCHGFKLGLKILDAIGS